MAAAASPPSQRRLFCACGGPVPVRSLRCRRCAQADGRSRRRFAGHRGAVLARDAGRCRGCGGAGNSLHVHHRQPGQHATGLLVTLCAACHAQVHRLHFNRCWLPEPLLEFWREQHPATPLQLQFPLEAAR